MVNADSMQLYRGMDIGTAKLTVAERAGVPHHLLDIWDVTEAASVSEYQRLARDAIADIQRPRPDARSWSAAPACTSGRPSTTCSFPAPTPALRARLEAELARVGPAALHARLAGLDPAAAAAILPSNGRRIVRALEVIELSGRPFSATLPDYESVLPTVQIGLDAARAELDQRIAARVGRMWQLGLVDEVRELAAAGPARGPDRQPGARATPRCSASWTGSGPRRRPQRRPSRRPGGSPAARSPGSAATRASAGCRPILARPPLTWPLAAVRRARVGLARGGYASDACASPRVTAPGTTS